MQKQGETAVFIAGMNFIVRLSILLTCPFFTTLCSFSRNWYCSIFIHYEIHLLLSSEHISFDLNGLFIIIFFPELCWICSCLLALLVQWEASPSCNSSAWQEPLGTGWKVCFPPLLGVPGLCTNSQQNHLGNHGHLPGPLLCSDQSRWSELALAGVLWEPHRERCACCDPRTAQMSWNWGHLWVSTHREI